MNSNKCIRIIKNYFDETVLIEEIGNHHLGRHFVFKVTSTNKYIMKFYFKEHKWEREVSSLILLESRQYHTPKLLEYGETNDIEWIVYEYIDGTTLDNTVLTEKELTSIYHSLGEEVSMIHKHFQYEKFGRLNLNGELYYANDTNKDYIRYIYQSTLKNLSLVSHAKQELIDKAVLKLDKSLTHLEMSEPGSLCHNDLSDRNILVKDGKFALLYDFEQSAITDRYRELALIRYYLSIRNTKFFEDFLEGYKKHYFVDMNKLNERSETYLLLYGIMICSWSLKVNKEYYDEGISILETYI